jgi:prophage tail gpP-like protein
MPQTENVTVLVGGQPYASWEGISVHASMKEAARSFQLVIADAQGAAAAHEIFASGNPVQIQGGSDQIFNGYVDRRRPHMAPGVQTIAVCGRAKGADAVDSSAKHDTGCFLNETPLDIANAIAPRGVTFTSMVQLQKIAQYQLNPGASVFREIERLLRDQGATMMGAADGSIVIVDASQARRQAGGLYQGQNIEQASSDLNDANRHKNYHVRGQSFDGHGAAAMQIEGQATDGAITRDRTRVIVIDGNTSSDRAKKRATYHRDRAAGEAIKAGVSVAGWRDDNGALFVPGNKVWTESAFLGLKQDMLIEHVTYTQTPKSTNAHLGLVDPRAYGGKAGQSSGSSSDWDIGE